MANDTVLIIPGFGDSGPAHWQTLWQNEHPGFRRVIQRDWEQPDCDEWANTLHRTIQAIGNPILLVAHSLGCILVAHWFQKYGESHSKVHGALLVSPTDVDFFKQFTPEIGSFSPIPLSRFSFPSIVVASSNDVYVSLKRAQQFAESWGSRFVNIGKAGHINAESGHGDWPEGKKLLAELRRPSTGPDGRTSTR